MVTLQPNVAIIKTLSPSFVSSHAAMKDKVGSFYTYQHFILLHFLFSKY